MLQDGTGKGAPWRIASAALVCGALLVGLHPGSALAQDLGHWSNREDGSIAYELNGTSLTGWHDIEVPDKTNRYYFDASGSMLTGWVTVDGRLCYFRPSGNLATGWADINGEKFYFKEGGEAVTGWADIDGKKYWFDDEGKMATGWREVGNGTETSMYYFRPSGSMATGFAEVDGKMLLFRESGLLAEGWGEWQGKKYYQGPNGVLRGEWLESAGEGGSVARYYFRESGVMQTGEAQIEGETYVFSDLGVLVDEGDGNVLEMSDGQVATEVAPRPTFEEVAAEEAPVQEPVAEAGPQEFTLRRLATCLTQEAGGSASGKGSRQAVTLSGMLSELVVLKESVSAILVEDLVGGLAQRYVGVTSELEHVGDCWWLHIALCNQGEDAADGLAQSLVLSVRSDDGITIRDGAEAYLTCQGPDKSDGTSLKLQVD